MIIAAVLRSGKEYNASHVTALVDGVKRNGGGDVPFVLLTDDLSAGTASGADVTIRLAYDWRGWWSKMALFDPALDGLGDILYFDLDTVIVGDLSEILAHSSLTLLRDFYRVRGLGSGLMRLPVASRRCVWEAWSRHPQYWMSTLRGDQDFLERHYLGADRWQDVLPGQVLSYKVHIQPWLNVTIPRTRERVVPEGARVVCYHGRPRPWATFLWQG